MIVVAAGLQHADGGSAVLAQPVRENRPGLTVVCISGYSEDALRQQIVDAEGIAFLPKPFSLNQLPIAVKRAGANPDPTY